MLKYLLVFQHRYNQERHSIALIYPHAPKTSYDVPKWQSRFTSGP